MSEENIAVEKEVQEEANDESMTFCVIYFVDLFYLFIFVHLFVYSLYS